MMRRLTPEAIDPKLYEEGFNDTDLLNRAPAGKRLSDLLERLDEPVVIALDGAWGSGKSHFLKRWVGAHVLEDHNTATTVYFDAFANDFLDDPLIGLTGAIAERFPAGEKEAGIWEKAKNAAARLVRPGLRVGAALVSAGLTEMAAPILDEAIKAGQKEVEAAAEAFGKPEDGRKAAMKQFRDALTQLTAPSADGAEDGKPLIIVIDELDRCRPDYALAVLETIKHFFAVPRVHFVLGVNLDALEHMVRSRYGAGINAADYLKRFITLTMQLPEHLDADKKVPAQLRFFEHSAKSMGIDPDLVSKTTSHISLIAKARPLTLRDIEKVLGRLQLLPQKQKFADICSGRKTLIISLAIFLALRPDLYRAATTGALGIEHLDEFYGITQNKIVRSSTPGRDQYDHPAYLIHSLWIFILSQGRQPKAEINTIYREFSQFRLDPDQILHILPRIERDYFGLFTLPD